MILDIDHPRVAPVRPTRDEAIAAAAAIYLEEKIRIETEKAIAAASGIDAHQPERAA